MELIEAIKSKDFERVDNILNSNTVDINFQDKNKRTPLMYAVSIDNQEFIKMLIEKGANPNLENSHGNDALYLSCIYGKYYSFKELIKYTNNINRTYHHGNTLLILACDYNPNNFEIFGTDIQSIQNTVKVYDNFIKLLLDYNANIYIRNDFGRDALLNSIINNRIDAFKLLLNKNNIYNIYINNNTILITACQYKQLKFIKYILNFLD